MGSDGLSRQGLVDYLHQLLDCGRFRDYGPNGLQVEGCDEILRIATACTASRAAIEAAVSAGANALIVHHGILWDKAPLPVTGMLKGRLAPLLRHDCSLLAYHLPLDAHPVHGNNAVLLGELGLKDFKPFAEYYGQPIGLWADSPQPLLISDLSHQLSAIVGHEVLHCPGNGEQVSRIGAVTGGGQSCLLAAATAGCQVLITGEASEQSWHEAQESGCHLLAAGHHATESIAVHRIGEALASRFHLAHHVIDIPNPI